MSDFGGAIVGEMFKGVLTVITVITIIALSISFFAYKSGKDNGYEQGVKDALSGKAKIELVTDTTSVIIKSK